jgi:phosphoribosylaminoimidazole (AIR) synthetase
MIAVVAAEDAAEIESLLAAAGEQVYRVGRIVARRAEMAGCVVDGMETAWRV